MAGKPQNLKNMKFDKLTAIEVFSRGANKSAIWLCKCDCGNEVLIQSSALQQDRPHSCNSCKSKKMWEQRPSHRGTKTRLYSIYHNMKKRCENKKASNYHNYGGRGISVCNEWKSFEPFCEWAQANGYQEDLTLDRIDNSKGYSPDNCRWITYKEQAYNTRQNHFITLNGETLTLTEWAEKLGINSSTICQRFKLGWSVEKALLTPVKHGRC